MRRGFLTSILGISLLLGSTVGAQEDRPDPALLKRLREVASQADSFPDHFDAQVWLTDMSARLERQVKDPAERLEILQRVHYEASQRDLPPELVLAVIDIESNFDHFAISVAGARGLMQIMPFWLDEMDEAEKNLMHIDTNVRFGCTILRYYMDIEKNDMRRALARYNGSLGNRKYPNKVLERLRTKWYRI